MSSKILVVEDDDDLRRGLVLRLRSNGYDVVQAADGLAAVSVARTERPDAVLLDIGLPGGDGFSVLEHYGHLIPLSATPVVVLSGRDRAVAEPVARQYPIAAFLSKPADNDELVETIEKALRGDLPAREDTPTTERTDS